MLALVKKPHIELSIHGERVEEIVAWIRKKYDVAILSTDDAEESVPVEETEFWKEMEKNRVGNLLAGARLKARLTQGQLAEKLEIRQNMVSDYEHGRRRLSPGMAKRFSAVLQVREAQLKYGGERPDQSEKAARKPENPSR
jgi:ribosome-binding protein aMBF1 (putative translation factor)